ncbi:hypothetical protein EAS68_09700 [Legionella jordanis]|nr:hypothetical protein EAS68_09700 [Legionella jordanis]
MAGNMKIIREALNLIWHEGRKFYHGQIPGFFTPYRSIRDTAITLSTPLCAPIILGFLTVCCTALTAMALLLYAVSYAFGKAAALLGANTLSRTVQDTAELSLVVGGVSLVLIPSLALATLISLPAGMLSIFTRLAASLCSLAGAEQKQEKQLEMQPI